MKAILFGTLADFSENSAAFGRQFAPMPAAAMPTLRGMRHLARWVFFVLLSCAGVVHAQPDAGLQQRLHDFAMASAPALPEGVRIEVVVGELDPRLRLSPCSRMEPYVPATARLWGRSRIGVRCADGPVRWNVYLPVTVKVWSRALVATAALPAGTVLRAEDVELADVDLAQEPAVALTDAAQAAGRTLSRPLARGQSVRMSHLKAKEWFAAGETVQVVATGPGFRVSAEGVALNPGVEGREVRVKTESGRVLTGTPVAQRRVEVSM